MEQRRNSDARYFPNHQPPVIQQQQPQYNTHSYYAPSGDQAQQHQMYQPQAHNQLQQNMSNSGQNIDGPTFTRERSSSNRNLPDTSRLQAHQPRRASDEVAGSSSHRISSRLSPAASRRSISVMNVGGGANGEPGHVSNLVMMRTSPRLSQANINKIRRDSNQQPQQSPTVGSPGPGSASQSHYGRNQYSSASQHHSSSASSPPTRGGSDSQPPAGMVGITCTPSGRRSSVVGAQSMAGLRSQKNSQSDATDHESPLNTSRRSQSSTPQKLAESRRTQQQQQGSQQPTPQGSNPGSRRNSSERTPQLQRKGSFAATTFRKFKRTMSLTKGPDPDQPGGSGQESRKSSSSSAESIPEQQVDMDLGATRTVKPGSGKLDTGEGVI